MSLWGGKGGVMGLEHPVAPPNCIGLPQIVVMGIAALNLRGPRHPTGAQSFCRMYMAA